ncbi:MAG TPA: radical SAM protein [Myxococcota bacterium]|nr:radical SAM protein [Myxococcota bacterium]
MSERFFKGYWMVTNRCNLDCGYCVLEDAPHQLRRELDGAGRQALVTHLHERLGFRRLTLSGGEVTILGRRAPDEFVDLLRHLRTLRSPDPRRHLEVEVYTNGALLDDRVADEMAGVVDLVAVTIDSVRDEVLDQIGRNRGRHRRYLDRAAEVCGRLGHRGIPIKLHSVVGTLNHATLADEVGPILDRVQAAGANVAKWKFYQYMSYNDPARDGFHAIDGDAYARTAEGVARALDGSGVALHFKDNAEMNASLFNILSYGNAQFMRPGDTWTTTGRTRDLRTYGSMTELFAEHGLDEAAFRRFHEVVR